jgi:putative tryptophan/tyrosine transport system ATP-binding protein
MNNFLLDIKNISFALPDADKAILHDVNYQIHYGDFIILLGSNGSGKSSLLKILDQRYKATSGKIMLAGRLLDEYKISEFYKCVTTLTQNCLDSLFTSLTVLDNCILVQQRTLNNLLHVTTKKEREFFAQYLVRFNEKLANKLDTKVSALSGGELQALSLALGVLQKPKILLLDEHTSALDPRGAERLIKVTAQIVAEFNITCVLVTHDLDIALQYGNRILAMHNGSVLRCIEEVQKQALTQQDLLKLCY